VRVGGRPLPRSAWSYRRGVLRATFRARAATLRVAR
jgi:hypothetical protein